MMMKNHISQRLFVVMAAVLSIAVAVPSFARKKQKKEIKTEKAVDTLSYQDSRRYAYFFLEAVRKQEAGQYAAAFDLLQHCLEINPNAPEAYFLRSNYYNAMHNDSLALEDLKKAAALNPANDAYQERAAQLYINTGNYAQAAQAYEKLYSSHRDRDDVLAILIQLYQQQKDYDNMLRTIDRLEQSEGETDQLTMMRMNAYEMKGDEKNAYKTLKSLADGHPNDVSFSLMLGNWLMQHKGQAEAYKIYQTVLKEEPDNTMAQSSMYDYYRATSQDTLADNMESRILLGKNTPSELRMQFLRQAIQRNEKENGDSSKIISLIHQMQDIIPKDTLLAQVKVAYYSLKKMPRDTIDNALTELLAIQPDNAAARVQLIQDYWGSENWKKIEELSEPGILYNPNEVAFYFSAGLARYYLKDDDGALDVFKRGTAEATDQASPDIMANMYSIMGDIYRSKGMSKEAYAAFDSCLQWKPDNVLTLNNYAYYLSEDGIQLKKAEEMSAKVIKAEPKNATYLDTYAWILYKEDRYAEAKIYIDLALKNDTDTVGSSTLSEHAGDIYVGLGDYKGAVSHYEQAIAKGGDAKALEKKIALCRKRIK